MSIDTQKSLKNGPTGGAGEAVMTDVPIAIRVIITFRFSTQQCVTFTGIGLLRIKALQLTINQKWYLYQIPYHFIQEIKL